MPKRSTAVVACAAAGVALFSSQAFVPAPKASRGVPISAVAGSIAALGAAPAFADEIGNAAAKLSEASYPFLKEIDWNSYVYNVRPGTASAVDWLKAIDKAIVMGAAMDPKLLKAGVLAHSKAIKSVDALGVTSIADYTEVNAALGRMVASVPQDKVMDVYNAFDAVVPKSVSEYMMSGVKEDDAKKAYAAFMDFKDVVKSNPITAAIPPESTTLSAEKLAKIGTAAQALSKASYPFATDVDWTSDLFQKPLPGAGPQELLKAVDKALIMGASMDSKLLREAAEAHHFAIGNIDRNGMTSPESWEAINVALGKLIASVPQAKTLDVFNSFKALTGPIVPINIFTTQIANAGDAYAAYDAFWKFKDVVKSTL